MTRWFLVLIAAEYGVAFCFAVAERKWAWAIALASWCAGNAACAVLMGR